MKTMNTTVVIGMGPASYAYLLSEIALGRLTPESNRQIVVVEQGMSLVKPPIRPSTEVNFGMGGAGTFSDGKLVASTTVGGTIPHITPTEYFQLADEALAMIESFKPEGDNFQYEWTDGKDFIIPEGVSLFWNKTKVCHLGTVRSQTIVKNIETYLRGFSNIRFLFGERVTDIIETDESPQHGPFRVTTRNDEEDMVRVISGHNVVNSAPRLVRDENKKREVHLGFRVESKNYKKYSKLIKANYDFKLSKEFNNSRARTFCACSDGAKVTPQLNGGRYHSWNGHGLANGKKDSVNYGILVTYESNKSQVEFDSELRKINKLYPNSPYPISIVNDPEFLKEYPVGVQLSQFVQELDTLIGITDEVVYIPEVEVVQKGLEVDERFGLISQPGMQIIGTASGYARSIIQAMISGILASKGGNA